MREPDTGWFHCGRCGSFFKAPLGHAVLRRCTHCGADPALALDDRRMRKVTADGVVVRDLAATGEEAQETSSGRTRRSRSRRRRTLDPTLRRLVILLGIWIALLGLFAVAMMARNQRREREEVARAARYKPTTPASNDPLAVNFDATQGELVNEAFPQCREALFGFLSSAAPETRSQWVHDPLRMLGPMSRFDQAAAPYAHDEMPTHEYVGLLDTPDGQLLETLWTAPDGRRIEAIFRRGQEGWRLDWESFVRFSETPWVMFLAGGGPATQEFRLLAREPLAEERRHLTSIRIVFHPPRFGIPGEAGPASPEFQVGRLSDPGRKLESLFALNRQGLTPFHAKVPTQDPEDMIRVRVRIHRTDDAGVGRRFVLEDVLAGHWLGIQASGIPDDLPPDPATPPTPEAPGPADPSAG